MAKAVFIIIIIKYNIIIKFAVIDLFLGGEGEHECLDLKIVEDG